jgi:hypothetical protein
MECDRFRPHMLLYGLRCADDTIDITAGLGVRAGVARQTDTTEP